MKNRTLYLILFSTLMAIFGFNAEVIAKEDYDQNYGEKDNRISLSSDQLEVHPGVVYFRETTPIKEVRSMQMAFVQRIAFLCKSKGFLLQGNWSGEPKDSISAEVVLQTTDLPLDRFDKNKKLIQALQTKCNLRKGTKNIELPVATGNTNTIFWLTKNTSVYGNEVSVWLRYVSSKTEEIHKGFPQVILDRKSLLSRHILDCSRQRFMTTNLIDFGEDGSVLYQDSKETPWAAIVPNSVFEAAFERVCSAFF